MSTGLLRNGGQSYHTIQSLLQRHSVADFIGAPILRSRPHQPQQSIYGKTREFEFSSPNILFSSPFSSTAVSSQKVGLVGWYLGMVKARPILTKSITSALIYTAADLSSQVKQKNEAHIFFMVCGCWERIFRESYNIFLLILRTLDSNAVFGSRIWWEKRKWKR